MPDKSEYLRREIALFRYSLIAEILCLPPGSAERWALIRDKARREHPIPGGRRTRVGITTIRDWLALYEGGGFDALHPKRRQDRGQPRGLPAVVVGIPRPSPFRASIRRYSNGRWRSTPHGNARQRGRIAP